MHSLKIPNKEYPNPVENDIYSEENESNNDQF